MLSGPTNTDINSNASGTPKLQGPDVPPALFAVSIPTSVVSITFVLPGSVVSLTLCITETAMEDCKFDSDTVNTKLLADDMAMFASSLSCNDIGN